MDSTAQDSIQPKYQQKEFELFKNKLDVQDNIKQRFIFSAPFGMGKTTYLREFFKSYESEYEVYHLFPVRYAAFKNEDVMEMIKLDLLNLIFLRQPSLFESEKESTTVDFLTKLGKYSVKNPLKVMLGLGIGLAYSVTEKYTNTEKFLNAVQEVLKDSQEVDNSDSQEIKELILDYKNNLNNKYNEDFVTRFIRENLNPNKKKSVLVIDDLDRIDAAEIFRILNAFSAHFDVVNDTNVNLFGFDKIILVANIDNLRSIYAHHHGKDAGFEGFIDKFYTEATYEFNNSENLKQYLQNRLTNDFIPQLEVYRSLDCDCISTFKALVEALISINLVTARHIKNFKLSTGDYQKYNYIRKNELQYKHPEIKVANNFYVAELIKTLFPNISNYNQWFKRVVNDLKSAKNDGKKQALDKLEYNNIQKDNPQNSDILFEDLERIFLNL